MNEYLIACIFLVLIFFSLGLCIFNNPGQRNSIYGYRTTAARRNQDTWDEANIYAGKCMMFCGIVMLLIVVVIDYIFSDVNKMFTLLGIFTLVSMLIVIMLTERRMKQVFFRDGKRKPNR